MVLETTSSHISTCSLCALIDEENLDVAWLHFLHLGLTLTPKAGAPALQEELEHAFSAACHVAMPPVPGIKSARQHFGTSKPEKVSPVLWLQTTMTACYSDPKAKSLYFCDRLSLSERPPRKMSFSNLENSVYEL